MVTTVRFWFKFFQLFACIFEPKYLIHSLLGPHESTLQTASGVIQLFCLFFYMWQTHRCTNHTMSEPQLLRTFKQKTNLGYVKIHVCTEIKVKNVINVKNGCSENKNLKMHIFFLKIKHKICLKLLKHCVQDRHCNSLHLRCVCVRCGLIKSVLKYVLCSCPAWVCSCHHQTQSDWREHWRSTRTTSGYMLECP